MEISELVSHVDLAPSLLAAAGTAIPQSMQGHSFLPLLDRHTDAWRNEIYFEMSEFMTGRGLRTPQYTYAAAAPKHAGWQPVRASDQYVEYMLHDLYADPHQHVNLAGNQHCTEISNQLRQRLTERIYEAGGVRAAIEPAIFPYP